MKKEILLKPTTLRVGISLALAACIASTPALATEMVYYPFNPSFGGNPLNGPVLLNSALATNRHTDPDAGLNTAPGATSQSALADFQASLERSVLSRLSAAATSKLFDSTGKLIPGTLSTENFTINITNAGDGLLSITTIDKQTGGSTTFTVEQ